MTTVPQKAQSRQAVEQSLGAAQRDSRLLCNGLRGGGTSLQRGDKAVLSSRAENAARPTASNNLHDFFGSWSIHRCLQFGISEARVYPRILDICRVLRERWR